MNAAAAVLSVAAIAIFATITNAFRRDRITPARFWVGLYVVNALLFAGAGLIAAWPLAIGMVGMTGFCAAMSFRLPPADPRRSHSDG